MSRSTRRQPSPPWSQASVDASSRTAETKNASSVPSPSGNQELVLWGGGGAIGTDTPIVYVDNLDAHLEHAKSAGAKIVTPITEHGLRFYTTEDCEGRHWMFAQAGPRVGV